MLAGVVAVVVAASLPHVLVPLTKLVKVGSTTPFGLHFGISHPSAEKMDSFDYPYCVPGPELVFPYSRAESCVIVHWQDMM